MRAGKFVSIYDRVSKLVSIDEDVEVRIEYGDERFFPAAYHVTEVRAAKSGIQVVLAPPATTCKARDRRVATGQTCCT